MADSAGFKQVQELLLPAQKILIVLPQKLNYDKVAAALSSYLSLKKAGKQSSLFCSKPMTMEYSSLVGINKVAKKLKGRNLVVSFDYVEDSIAKVSYNIENNKFNLVVQPKEGFPPLSAKKVNYSYGGIRADLIFVFGALSLNELGPLYFDNKALFEEEKVINLDINEANHRFGKVNLIYSQAASYSEAVVELLYSLKLPVDRDIAGNLFRGIEKATRLFSSPKVRANTFEAAAFCLRSGADRRLEKEKSGLPKKPRSVLRSKPAQVSTQKTDSEKPSPDWLEPKIYKGNTLA